LGSEETHNELCYYKRGFFRKAYNELCLVNAPVAFTLNACNLNPENLVILKILVQTTLSANLLRIYWKSIVHKPELRLFTCPPSDILFSSQPSAFSSQQEKEAHCRKPIAESRKPINSSQGQANSEN